MDNNGDTTFFPFFIIFSIFFILGLLATIYLYLKKKKWAFLPITISIIIIIGISGFSFYIDVNTPITIEYKATIKTDTYDEFSICIPYIDSPDLRKEIEIKAGLGEIEFVELNASDIVTSNTAMKINSNNDLTIYGEATEEEIPDMSLYIGEGDRYIELFWVWCDKSNPDENISLTISAHISYDGGGQFWGDVNNYLQNGWNIIKLEHGIEND